MGGLNGSFATQSVLVPPALNDTYQKAGMLCTGYFVKNYDTQVRQSKKKKKKKKNRKQNKTEKLVLINFSFAVVGCVPSDE